MSNFTKSLIGDTLLVTWINSGATASPITFAAFTGSETIVSSASMVDSGNGHYYGNLILYADSFQSPAYYEIETLATVSGLPYKRRKTLKVISSEVD